MFFNSQVLFLIKLKIIIILYNIIFFNIILYLEKQGYNITDFPTFKHISTFDRGDLFNKVFNDNIRRLD